MLEDDISQFIADEQVKANKIVELKSWEQLFRKNEKNHPLSNSVYNIELILENDTKLYRKLSYNEFSQESEIRGDIVLNDMRIANGYIEDDFTHALKSYIEQNYNFIPQSSNIESAVINVSRKNSYHPLKDYLDKAKLNWDKTQRIRNLLPDYLGVEKSDYAYKGLLCLLVGAIQKVDAPYEKFDFIFDFVGDTGTGKTTFIQKLFLETKGYYTDSMKSFTQTDDYAIMQRAWCVNDDELVVSKKTGIEVIKKFASQKELEYRTPYARRGIRRPKNFIIVRTSNESGHLKDETGNRRFVPFKVSKKHQRYHPLNNNAETQLTDELIMQIWGEAMAAYEKIDRKKFYIEMENLAANYLDDFMAVDSVKDIVYTILEIPVPIDFYSYNDNQRASYIQGYLENNGTRLTLGTMPISPSDLVPRDRVRIRDLSIEGFNEQYGKNNKRDKKIRIIMDNHPTWERSKKNGIRFGRQTNTGYLKKEIDK